MCPVELHSWPCLPHCPCWRHVFLSLSSHVGPCACRHVLGWHVQGDRPVAHGSEHCIMPCHAARCLLHLLHSAGSLHAWGMPGLQLWLGGLRVGNTPVGPVPACRRGMVPASRSGPSPGQCNDRHLWAGGPARRCGRELLALTARGFLRIVQEKVPSPAAPRHAPHLPPC